MQLAVPVRQVRVAVLSTDGIWSTGSLFLNPLAANHSGSETVLDRLNDQELFLPVQLPGERSITLLHKTHIVRLVVEEAQPGDALTEDQENLSGRIEPVHCTVARGQPLSGWLSVQAPEWKARLSDYVNNLPGTFFPLYADDALHLINKHAVLRIQSQG
ncbi:MAG TPA: hypothetical protein VED18_12870 [Candidatus Sulfotelmatobacter sp.]|nr:hypothetical protein [Candidatus Sulfotelmatobacter sp.]